jgi:hypothetical protein
MKPFHGISRGVLCPISARRRFVHFALSVAMMVAAYVESAKALPDLDRLLITRLSTGAVLFDQTIPHPPPYPYQLHFGETVPFDPQCCLGIHYLILTRPPGEPYGDHPVFVPGTGLVASDLVTFYGFGDRLGPWFIESFYYDDDDPQFEMFVLHAPTGTPLLEKTGELQDVTNLLQSNLGDWRIQVQSAVIPEPSSALLLTAGLVALALRGRSARFRSSS